MIFVPDEARAVGGAATRRARNKGEARASRPFTAGDRVILREQRNQPGRLRFRVCKVFCLREQLEIKAVDPTIRLSSSKSGRFCASWEHFTHAR